MKLVLQYGHIYVDNIKFCKFDGEPKPGVFPVEARYSHHHARTLPFIDGIGWIGSEPSDHICVGQVRNRLDVIGDSNTVKRLVACIETADETGNTVVAEII